MRGWIGRLSLVLVCVSAFGTPAIGANIVEIESKCVAPGATGVTINIFLVNDDSLTALTLPLEVRSVSGGAFIAASTSLVPSGRVADSDFAEFVLYYPSPEDTNLCSGPLSNTYRNGVGSPAGDFYDSIPSGIFWNGFIISHDLFPPGDDISLGTPSLIITTDVGESLGSFEIDTCCTRPVNHLRYVRPDLSLLIPEFIKGVITVTTTIPEWDSIGAIVNAWGDSPGPLETATLSVSAIDPDCDSLTLTALFLPPNSEFVQTGSHTGLFTFTPDSSQSLTNGTMLFIVGDERGADTSAVEWVVTAWSAVRSAGGPVPESYVLDQNYPNPFNAGTVIPFSVGQHGHVRIAVYNILGNQVATLVDEELAPGRYTADWDGRSSDGRPVATGIYFYRISSDAHVATRKMLFLK